MKHFTIESNPISMPSDPADDAVRLLTINWKGKAIAGFNQSARRTYVYPVTTPAGVIVTNDRPTTDHPFHQSITVGNDYVFTYRTSEAGRFEDPGMCFYTNMPDMRGRGEGQIATWTHNEVTELAENQLEFIPRMQWRGPEEGYSPKVRRVIAEEQRTITVTAAVPGTATGHANIIDVRSQLYPTSWDIRLGPSRHGYFTVRVADWLRAVDLRSGEPQGGTLIDSQGRTNDQVCWQHADWIDYYGTDDQGRTAGLAIFQFPSLGNVAWYAGSYGTVRVNPFRRGATYVSRGDCVDVAIRVVAHDGTPQEAGIAGLYEAFEAQVR